MHAVHDPGEADGCREHPDRRRQRRHFQPDAGGEGGRGGGVPGRNELVTGVRPGRRAGGTSPAGRGLRTRPLARTLLAALAIAMPARPRRAARRPRSSLLAASAAAMPIHNAKKSADRLSVGRKRSSIGELSAERRAMMA